MNCPLCNSKLLENGTYKYCNKNYVPEYTQYNGGYRALIIVDNKVFRINYYLSVNKTHFDDFKLENQFIINDYVPPELCEKYIRLQVFS